MTSTLARSGSIALLALAASCASRPAPSDGAHDALSIRPIDPHRREDAGAAAPSGLSRQDLDKRWIELPLPGAAGHLVRDAKGYLSVGHVLDGDTKFPIAVDCFLYRSTDGARWSRVPFDAPHDALFAFRGFAYGNGRYVLVANRGPRSEVWSSTDALHWSKQVMSDQLSGVHYVDRRFFATTVYDRIFVSSDGEHWQPSKVSALQPSTIDFGNGRFVLGGSGPLQVSEDGLRWTAVSLDCTLPGACITDPSGGGHQAFHDHVVFAEGRFYTGRLASDDGERWIVSGAAAPEAYVEGYFFGHEMIDGGRVALAAWTRSEPARAIDVERPALPRFAYGQPFPDTIESKVEGGLSCATARCLVIDNRLYLVP